MSPSVWLVVAMLVVVCGVWLAVTTPPPEPFSFPTREPRGPVHFHSRTTTAELMKALQPGRQPQSARVIDISEKRKAER